jgi:hypothetical protein
MTLARTSFLRAAAIAVALLLPAASARACSICHCDDPSATAGDLPFFFTQRWRLSFEAERFQKDQAGEADMADPGAAPGRELETENRYTVTGAWRAHPKLTLIARVPYSHKTIETGDELSLGNGFSDPEFLASLCASRAGMGPTARSITLNLGVRAPWGQNDLQQGGERAEEHLQPGTGATGLSGGINFYRRSSTKGFMYGTVLGRWNGTNAHDYHYGDALVASAMYQHDLTTWLGGVAGLDYRSAAHDLSAGERDPNTGGAMLYFTPRLEVALGARWALRFGAQLPIASNLYGDQREFANYQTQIVLRP